MIKVLREETCYKTRLVSILLRMYGLIKLKLFCQCSNIFRTKSFIFEISAVFAYFKLCINCEGRLNISNILFFFSTALTYQLREKRISIKLLKSTNYIRHFRIMRQRPLGRCYKVYTTRLRKPQLIPPPPSP